MQTENERWRQHHLRTIDRSCGKLDYMRRDKQAHQEDIMMWLDIRAISFQELDKISDNTPDIIKIDHKIDQKWVRSLMELDNCDPILYTYLMAYTRGAIEFEDAISAILKDYIAQLKYLRDSMMYTRPIYIGIDIGKSGEAVSSFIEKIADGKFKTIGILSATPEEVSEFDKGIK